MNKKGQITIAVDGYSSCGKSTLARSLANELGYVFIDSGAMYRAVTLHAIQAGYFDNDVLNEKQLLADLNQLDLEFKANITTKNLEIFLNGTNVESAIRSMEVATKVSIVAAIKEVRKILVEKQRNIGKNGGVVMDGRDIASVVFPHAELKIFVTASLNVRSKRRFDELQAKGDKVSMEAVEKNLRERDYIDTHRSEGPLLQVADAVVLDNSNLTREEQLAWALQQVENVLNTIIPH